MPALSSVVERLARPLRNGMQAGPRRGSAVSNLFTWTASLILTHGGALSNLPLFLALDAGLLAARGLDVTAPKLDGFGATASRLRDGSADLGTTGFTQALADADDVDPLVIVAGSGLRGMAIVGQPGCSMRDLSGPVGTFADDPMQVLLADEVSRHGLADRIEVRFLSSLAEAAAALADGTLAAVTTVEPWIGRLLGQGFALLSDGSEVWGGSYPDTVLVARRSTMVFRAEAVSTTIGAMLDAEAMIAADPDGALAAVAHRFPTFSPAELRAGLAGQPPRVDLRGLEASILARWPTVRHLAGHPDGPPPPGLIDLTCLADALSRTDRAFPITERNSHVH